MATCGFYEVHEINHETATDADFASCISVRRSVGMNKWVGEQWEDLAKMPPEKLPRCFVAVQADALSPRTGWTTEHGCWEPKELFAGPSVLDSWGHLIQGATPEDSLSMWVKTTLVFRPKDGSKSDLAMNMYNVICWKDNSYFLEEDMALCRIFTATKGERQRF